MQAVPPIPSTKQERCRRQQFWIVFVNNALEWLLSENNEMIFISFSPFLDFPKDESGWLGPRRMCSKRFTLALLFSERLQWIFTQLRLLHEPQYVSAWVKSNQSPSWCKNILNCSISSRKGKGSIVSQDLKLTENIWSCSERPWYFAGIFQIFRRDIPNVAVVPFNFSASAA